MTVRVLIDTAYGNYDVRRETFDTLGDDPMDCVRNALAVLDGIRADIARMAGPTPQARPLGAAVGIVTFRDGVPVCLRCGAVLDDPQQHYEWHGRVDSNTTPTTPRGTR